MKAHNDVKYLWLTSTAATAAAAEAQASAADVEDAEEDDESGEDILLMWLDELPAAEYTLEPGVRTVAESDSDDDLEMRSS
jgi:hypothetical protein